MVQEISLLIPSPGLQAVLCVFTMTRALTLGEHSEEKGAQPVQLYRVRKVIWVYEKERERQMK